MDSTANPFAGPCVSRYRRETEDGRHLGALDVTYEEP